MRLAVGDGAVFTGSLNTNDQTVAIGSDLVNRLRNDYKQRVSIIYGTDERPVTATLSSRVGTILDQVARGDPQYHHEVISGHEILLAHPELYHRQVSLPDSIANDEPQMDALWKYAQWLRTQPGFETLVGPIIVTGRAGRTGGEHVTLRRQATVLEHLVQLLAQDSMKVFTIAPAPSGRPGLNIHRIHAALSEPPGGARP